MNLEVRSESEFSAVISHDIYYRNYFIGSNQLIMIVKRRNSFGL